MDTKKHSNPSMIVEGTAASPEPTTFISSTVTSKYYLVQLGFSSYWRSGLPGSLVAQTFDWVTDKKTPVEYWFINTQAELFIQKMMALIKSECVD